MLYPLTTRTRDLLQLDGIWDFARELQDKDYSAGFSPEKKIAVPGSINDLFTEAEMRTWSGKMWLSKSFHLPESLKDKRLVLRFGAATNRAKVVINGKSLGENHHGYTPFEFDITESAHVGGENLLCVRLDHCLSDTTVPMGSLGNNGEPGQLSGQNPDTPFDFFPYSGLHRPVSIYTTHSGGWLDRVRISAEPQFPHSSANVQVSGIVMGKEAHQVSVKIIETGKSATTTVRQGQFNLAISIDQAKLWDVGSPHLYHARCQVFNEHGTLLDEYTERFGVRKIEVSGRQLLLNRKPVYLKGLGRHEDFHLTGRGMNHCVNIRDFELLRWINGNSFRTTHYPHAEESIRLADELGVLIIGETPAVSINLDYATDETLQQHLESLQLLIERDFNNPSVIMWSVANEATTNRPSARPYFEKIADLARTMDNTRPVTMVSCKGTDDQVMDLFDVACVNLYPGWYEFPGNIPIAREEMRRHVEGVHRKFGKPVFVTEFGADCIAGLHRLPAEQWSEEFQVELVMALIEEIRSCDFIIGEHVWSLADFRTGQHFWRAWGNRKGVFTRDRQPKMLAHWLRKQWAPEHTHSPTNQAPI